MQRTDARDAVRAFQGRFDPVKVPLGYRAALVLMLLVVLLNVAVYVGFIAFLVSIAADFADRDFATLSRPLTAILVSGAVIIGVTIAIYIFLRPLWLFVKRTPHAAAPVSSRDEPDLYAFVMTIAGLVGAPLPSRIMIDARVSANAALGSLVRGELTLVLGLPLAGLGCRQLAGVVARELGHFSQTAGMRFAFLVRRLESALPLILEELENVRHATSRNVVVDFIFFSTPRMAFTAMHTVTRPVARLLERQLARHADRYQARVAGSHAFVSTAVTVAELRYASREVWSGIAAEARPARISQMIIMTHAQQSPDFKKAVLAEVSTGATRWGDAQPSDAERIAAATAEGATGVYKFEGPAKILFRDFESLDRQASAATFKSR